MKPNTFTLVLGAILTLAASVVRAAPPEQADVFVAGQDGYKSYRIPALLVTKAGTLLAFCEGRVTGRGDSGDIDLILKRSTDGGKTFGKTLIVWDDAGNTCGNPAPVIDRDTGTIWLLMTRNGGADKESDITADKPGAARTVWVTHSTDDGQTWAKPTEVTATTKKPEWTWYATGPGAGIQLKSGRLVIPCDHKTGGDQGYSHAIYSDDHGKTWAIGGVAGPMTNESRVVELSDGRLMLNMRIYRGGNAKEGRAIATSTDQGKTWSAVTQDAALQEPVCQAALIPFSRDPKGSVSTFLFSNPASTKRENLTVRLSTDDCKNWPHAKSLHKGPAAYSDLAVLLDQTICCLYERGDKSPYDQVTLARFTLDWLRE